MNSENAILQILLVDDDEEEYILIKELLADGWFRLRLEGTPNFKVDWTPSFQEALAAIAAGKYDAYLVDYRLGRQNGLDLIRAALEKNQHAPLILITGQGSYRVDMEAMKAGATDYLAKETLTAPLLERTIRYAIDRKRAEKRILDHSRRVEMLSALSQAFAEARLEYPGVLDTIVEQISAALGDACVIRLVIEADGSQWLDPVAYHHPDPQIRAGLKQTLQRLSPSVEENLTVQVFRTGRSALIGAFEPTTLREHSPGEYAEFLIQTGLHSVLIFPLRSKVPRVIGTLSLMRFGLGEAFTLEDHYLLQELADRAALEIENARLYAEVQKLAITDSLTELYNRRGFFEMAHYEFERARRFNRPLSLVMLDLDHLKDINDAYGHTAGDRVLQILSGRIHGSTREMDVIGRYGGDEFIILLPETDQETALIVAERVRRLISEPVNLSAEQNGLATITVTTSIGVAYLSEECPDLQTLIKRADQAAYRSKHLGRNQITLV